MKVRYTGASCCARSVACVTWQGKAHAAHLDAPLSWQHSVGNAHEALLPVQQPHMCVQVAAPESLPPASQCIAEKAMIAYHRLSGLQQPKESPEQSPHTCSRM